MAEDDERELTEEEQAEADRKAKRKQKIKLALLALLLVLLSVGVTLGLLYFLVPDDPEPTDGTTEQVEDAEPPEPAKQQAIYFPLKEKFVINYNVRGRQRFLQTEVNLMFRDNEVAGVLEQHLPRVRNDLIMLFSGQEFEDLQTAEGRELLRQDALRRVQAILEQEMGQPGVEQVLFTSFVMQ